MSSGSVFGMDSMSPSSTYALAFVLMVTTSAVCLLWHCRAVCLRFCGMRRNQEADVESSPTFEPAVTGAPQYIIRRLPVFRYNPQALLQKEASRHQQHAADLSGAGSAQPTPSSCKPQPAAHQAAAAPLPPTDTPKALGQEGHACLAAPPPAIPEQGSEQQWPTAAAAGGGGGGGGHLVVSFSHNCTGVHVTVQPSSDAPPPEATTPTTAKAAGNGASSSSSSSSTGGAASSSSSAGSSSGEPSPHGNAAPAAPATAAAAAGGSGGGSLYSTFRDDQGSCVVCFEDYETGELLKELPCGHWYHASCIDAWLKRNASCPLCKKVVWRALPADALPLWHELLRLGVVSPDFMLARSSSGRETANRGDTSSGGGRDAVGSGIGRARSLTGV